MFSCEEFLQAFGEHMEEELPEEIRRELEEHLAQCRSCQVVVDSTAKSLRVVTETGRFDVSEPLPDAAIRKIMARIRGK